MKKKWQFGIGIVAMAVLGIGAALSVVGAVDSAADRMMYEA